MLPATNTATIIRSVNRLHHGRVASPPAEKLAMLLVGMTPVTALSFSCHEQRCRLSETRHSAGRL
jgi:hypothetical protein